MLAMVVLFFVLFYFIDYKNLSFIHEKFIFFKDYTFYIGVLFSVLCQQFHIKLFKANENNLSYAKFGDFIFLSLVPIASFLSLFIFDFDDAINIDYSFKEMITFSACLFFLSFLLFKNKIKNRTLKKPMFLVYYILFGVCSFVIIGKLMQIYHAPAVYVASMSISFFIWTFLAKKNNEHKLLNKESYKVFFLFSLIYLTYSILNLMAISILPIEHITILRTVFSVIIVAFYDFCRNKYFNLTKKDIFLLFLMFLTMFLFI